jgi:hypothetical protein
LVVALVEETKLEPMQVMVVVVAAREVIIPEHRDVEH